MSIYVLVHGGDRDGTIWNPITAYLEERGHTVYAPSMSSVTRASLHQNIDEVLDVFSTNSLQDVILCGHSYGAMVITGVCDKIPNKVEQLVFVDSAIPEDGKSLYGMFSESGFDYKNYGLTADPACLETLHFDEEEFFKKPKAYVHCLQSEFLSITKPIYDRIKEHHENWLYFCLDTIHGCMFTQPRELVVIFNGLAK